MKAAGIRLYEKQHPDRDDSKRHHHPDVERCHTTFDRRESCICGMYSHDGLLIDTKRGATR